jgi:hypothetical protein
LYKSNYSQPSSLDTANIDSLISQKERLKFSFLVDTLFYPAKKDSLKEIYSLIKHSFIESTRELVKIETILAMDNKSILIGYFDKDKIIKAIANTEIGSYVYYYNGSEITPEFDKSLKGGVDNDTLDFSLFVLKNVRAQQLYFKEKIK